MPSPQFYQLHDPQSPATQASIRAELHMGLLNPAAQVSPKYLYDSLGSRIFDAITELPEYYPTRTEATIFASQRTAIAQVMPQGAAWIDLGAGSCAKAAGWFAAAQPRQYVAVDISADYLRDTLANLQLQHSQIDMVGVGMDFSEALDFPVAVLSAMKEVPITAFYPGSSIGNFTPAQAQAFLHRVQHACAQGQAGGGLLIGVDLVKNTDVLEAAYDDAVGVTAAFNLNMLRHINTLLGANFNVRQWQHVALFNTQQSRIEMHVQARESLTVRWSHQGAGVERHFSAGERIHTENSYKWTIPGFSSLLEAAGFSATKVWTDPDTHFAVFWAKA